MDLAPFRPWLSFVHVVGVLAFVLLHGASATVAFKLRGERDRVRIGALLELSNAYLNWMYLALLVPLVGGILSGIAAGFWTSGDLWIWASLVLFIAILVAMYALATPYFEQLRHALGMATYNDVRKKLDPPPPASDAELARLLASPRPVQTAVVGLGGIAVIAWLMMMKPF